MVQYAHHTYYIDNLIMEHILEASILSFLRFTYAANTARPRQKGCRLVTHAHAGEEEHAHT